MPDINAWPNSLLSGPWVATTQSASRNLKVPIWREVLALQSCREQGRRHRTRRLGGPMPFLSGRQPRLFREERGRLGRRIVAQTQHVEAAEVDVLPEHGLVVVGPVHLDVPDAALVGLVELDIGGVLILQHAFEFVITF